MLALSHGTSMRIATPIGCGRGPMVVIPPPSTYSLRSATWHESANSIIALTVGSEAVTSTGPGSGSGSGSGAITAGYAVASIAGSVGQTDPMEHSESPTPRGVAAVVLAAGAGTRFERSTHKLRAEIDGVPVVRRAVEAAVEAGFDEVIVVTGSDDLLDVLPDEVTVIRNDMWQDGQASSLQVAVAYAGSVGHRAVVFGLGDSPGVPAEAWARGGERRR